MPWCFDEGVRGGVSGASGASGQLAAGFFKVLHIDLGVAIERRENFGATGREAISAQDIGFLGVATDKDSEGGVASDMTTNFGDVGDEEVIN